METVTDSLYLTLAQEFDVTQVPQRSVTLESSCCPEATSVFLAANSPPSCPRWLVFSDELWEFCALR
jgi:hypothetical protein